MTPGGRRFLRFLISGSVSLVCLLYFFKLDLGNQSRWGGYGTWPHPLYFIVGIGAPLVGGIAAMVAIYNLVALILLSLARSKSGLVSPEKTEPGPSENDA